MFCFLIVIIDLFRLQKKKKLKNRKVNNPNDRFELIITGNRKCDTLLFTVSRTLVKVKLIFINFTLFFLFCIIIIFYYSRLFLSFTLFSFIFIAYSLLSRRIHRLLKRDFLNAIVSYYLSFKIEFFTFLFVTTV